MGYRETTMKSAVKERPAIMAGHSVRKIFADEKTMTRRVIKPQPEFGIEFCPYSRTGWAYSDDGVGERCACTCKPVPRVPGQPGDRLWVKETWLELEMHHWVFPTRGAKNLYRVAKRRPFINSCAYKAECSEESDKIRKQYGYRWKSPMFMPRWASRLTLEIKDIKVERLCMISELDAYKEGYSGTPCPRCNETGIYPCENIPCEDCNGEGEISGRMHFKESWNQLNQKRGFGWNKNPWVWVIEFERLKEQN